MKKSIVLCADDYGQAKAISRGIISLLEKGRLSAVSCLVTASDWQEQAGWLLPFQDRVDIGLHFNLTESGPYTLPQLMGRSLLRCLDAAFIEQRLQDQLDRFESAFGRAPDFIDGHQHVHQFPVIRDVLVKVYKARFHQKKPYIRLINTRVNHFKKAIIYGMGTSRLRHLLEAAGIPYNRSFAGIYDFHQASDYERYFPLFLTEIQDGGIIMCHPGLSEAGDVIGAAREHEYRYLMGEAMPLQLARHGVVLGRFLPV